jgi:hypothetical protein
MAVNVSDPLQTERQETFCKLHTGIPFRSAMKQLIKVTDHKDYFIEGYGLSAL